MAVEKPTWEYKSEGDWQTASEMNQLAQAVITNATELSNTKDDVASLSNDVSGLDNRLTTIEGSVASKADDDDLENTIIDGVQVIREKTTKTYNPENYSGMGRVILRKNMVGTVNVLTQSMVNQANTIYEIRYEFDLEGAEVEIPKDSILKFNGGKLTNGFIIGNNTTIQSAHLKILQNVNIKGTFANTDYYAEWFGAKTGGYNQDIYIQSCIDSFNNVTLLKGTYHTDNPIILTSYQSIKGQGDALGGTIINKITKKSAEGIPETNNKVNLNKNAIILIVPRSDDASGANQYNYVTVENVALHGTESEYGIFASDGRYTFIKNVFILNCKFGVRVEYSWMQYFSYVRMVSSYSTNPFDTSVGFLINSLAPYSGYTTIKFRDCYVQKYHYGYKLYNCTYGTFDNCACDGSIITAYWFYNNHGLTINANGNESSYLTDANDSAAYYFEFTEATLNGCYSTDDGTNKDLETKYYMKVGNNSRITLINCIRTNDVGNKIKVFWYSCIQFLGERIIVDEDSLFECSDGSSVVHYYNGNIKRIGDYPVSVAVASIVTSSNFRDKIPDATPTTSGLMPAGYLPSNDVPSTIKDANDLTSNSYYVSGNIANLPDNRWGMITTIRIGKTGTAYQWFVCFSDDSLYYRDYGTSWSSWKRLSSLVCSTADRPETDRNIGMQVFDVTLKRPIWWDGTKWVDATGINV